jgi:hypothetical protein
METGALLRKPDFAAAYLELADVCARRHDYHGQVADLETYLRLEPAGPANLRVRQAREVALKILSDIETQERH